MELQLPASVQGNGPTLRTVVDVGRILSDAGAPLSLAEIGRRMPAKQVRHAAIRASVDFLAQLGYVTLGSKGALWTHNPDPRLWQAADRGVRLR